jgi:hypothetical protein
LSAIPGVVVEGVVEVELELLGVATTGVDMVASTDMAIS